MRETVEDAIRVERDKAHREVERLRAALLRYGQHVCRGSPCDCGWPEMRAALVQPTPSNAIMGEPDKTHDVATCRDCQHEGKTWGASARPGEVIS